MKNRATAVKVVQKPKWCCIFFADGSSGLGAYFKKPCTTGCAVLVTACLSKWKHFLNLSTLKYTTWSWNTLKTLPILGISGLNSLPQKGNSDGQQWPRESNSLFSGIVRLFPPPAPLRVRLCRWGCWSLGWLPVPYVGEKDVNAR